MNPSCESCRYFQLFTPAQAEINWEGPGECHRYPRHDIHGHPIVQLADWCGEHRPVETPGWTGSSLNPAYGTYGTYGTEQP